MITLTFNLHSETAFFFFYHQLCQTPIKHSGHSILLSINVQQEGRQYKCFVSTKIQPISAAFNQLLRWGLLMTTITCLTSSAMPRENAKVAPQCLCGTSEFCVEIISLFSCHLGCGCWRVVQARCFSANTTEGHLQQMFMGRARHPGTDLESDSLCANLEAKA